MSKFFSWAKIHRFSKIYIHWRRQWQPTPVLLPRKSHGWRSLVGCSPWGHYQSDTTERLHFHFSLSCIGEGNGNPLQCSCLENPRDGGAWWAAQSRILFVHIYTKTFFLYLIKTWERKTTTKKGDGKIGKQKLNGNTWIWIEKVKWSRWK